VININREQKRNAEKFLRSKGIDPKKLEYFLRTKEVERRTQDLPEGTKVKLDNANIQSHPDYPRLTEKYRSWVEGHSEDIFTVEYDPKYQNNPTLVCLKEDETPRKWLFWIGDLIRV
jgi:hypothetical protein